MLNLVTNPKEFREKIEDLVVTNNMTYLDAVVHCCQSMGIEFETAAKLLGKVEKEIIRQEAKKLNLLKE